MRYTVLFQKPPGGAVNWFAKRKRVYGVSNRGCRNLPKKSGSGNRQEVNWNVCVSYQTYCNIASFGLRTKQGNTGWYQNNNAIPAGYGIVSGHHYHRNYALSFLSFLIVSSLEGGCGKFGKSSSVFSSGLLATSSFLVMGLVGLSPPLVLAGGGVCVFSFMAMLSKTKCQYHAKGWGGHIFCSSSSGKPLAAITLKRTNISSLYHCSCRVLAITAWCSCCW